MQKGLTLKHKTLKHPQVRPTTISVVCFVFLMLVTSYGSAWDLVKIENRDYVRIEELAEFYKLGQPISLGGSMISLAGANSAIRFNVGSRESVINGVKHWLCFPVLEVRGQPMLSRTDLSKTIDPIMQPERILPRRRVETVIIDPGHGGDNHGARGRWTRDEKDLTLEAARHLRDELRSENLVVVMTRNRDVFVSLEDRARETQRRRNAIFVSLHYNHGGPNGRGTEVFAIAPRGAPATMQSRPNSSDYIRLSGHAFDTHSVLLAHAIERRIAPLHGVENSRGVKRARFRVLRDSWCPAVLVEAGFLTNRQDSMRIARQDFSKRLAQAIRQGVRDYIDSLEGRRSYSASLP